MEYRVVFDNTTIGYTGWHFASFGMVGVLIGAILVAIVKRRGALPFKWWSTRPRASKRFALYILIFSLFWTITAFYSTYAQFAALKKAQANGTAQVVAGVVTHFTPMPATGHAMERFCVQETCFSYSDYVITAGFNHTSSHGGPIREGLPVRVTYVGAAIIKLEVATESRRTQNDRGE
jgi:hypothetical protein